MLMLHGPSQTFWIDFWRGCCCASPKTVIPPIGAYKPLPGAHTPEDVAAAFRTSGLPDSGLDGARSSEGGVA